MYNIDGNKILVSKEESYGSKNLLILYWIQ